MPRKKKPTPKEILKKIYKEKEISKGILSEIGIDHNKLPIENKNFLMRKNFFGEIKIEVKDKKADLDGKPLNTNQILINRILKHWHSGKKTILFSEMLDLNIFTPLKKLRIGENILLVSDGEECYKIQRYKEDKDLESRWENHAVTMKRVVDALRDYEFNAKRQKMGETALNKDLVTFFKSVFVYAEKPTRGQLIDIAVGKGDNRIWIELKLGKQIKKRTESLIARSQIEDYCNDFPKERLMVLIAGTKADKKEKYVQDVLAKAKQLKLKTIYLNPE